MSKIRAVKHLTPPLISLETPQEQWLKIPVGNSELITSLEQIAQRLSREDIREILALLPGAYSTFSYERH